MNTNIHNKRISLFVLCALAVVLLITHMFSIGVYADSQTAQGSVGTEPVADTSGSAASDSANSAADDNASASNDSQTADSNAADSKDQASGTESKAESASDKAESASDKAESTSDKAGESDTSQAENNFQAPNGIWDKLAVPFGAIIRFCYKIIPNYAIALLLFAVIMKVILFPLGIRQQKNMVKQASLRPKEAAIRKKYAGRTDKPTQQKMQQEIMDLYQKENFSPMGGCLPLLLQFPILFALFRVVYNPLRHVTGLSLSQITEIGNRLIANGVGTARDFAMGDITIVKHINADNFHLLEGISDKLTSVSDLPNLTIFGGALDLSGTPTLSWNVLLIIPIATFIIVFLSMWLTRKLSYQPEQTADMKVSNRIMDLVMPAMSTWFTFMYPAILGIYWIYQNVLGVLQQLVLKKMYPIPVFTEEDYAKAEREYFGKNPKKKKGGTAKRHPKSLHHIDDDDEDEPAELQKPQSTSKKSSGKDAADSVIAPAPIKEDVKHNEEPDETSGENTSDDN